MRDLANALLLINKNAQFVLRGNEIEWHGPGKKPSDTEIKSALDIIKRGTIIEEPVVEEDITVTKVEVQPSPYSIDTVLNLQPILYREITPTGIVINHEGDKIPGIDNTDLTNDAIIGALVNSIKDLKKLIDDQAKEIDTLKKQENRVIVIPR